MTLNFKMTKSVCALSLLLGFICATPANAGMPTEQLRVTVDRVLSILKDPKLNADSAQERRRRALRDAIFPRFDFAEMAKRSLGSEWRRRTPAEQNEFVRLFTDLLRDSYVTSIESYRGERVIYRRERLDGSYAEVDTAIVTERGEQFTIDYRLNLAERDWKVYDVIVENVSIVNNFRSQFRRVVSRSGFEELLRRLRDKSS